jgi:hypothetical protein
MPLTPEQKKQKVIEAGLDPSQYTYVEPNVESSVNPETDFPLEAKVTEPTVPPQVGAPEAFGRSALRSLIPSGGALAGMRAGAMLPLPHPLLKGAAILGGGLLGSLGTGWGQEKVLQAVEGPKAYDEGLLKQQQAREQQKVASTLGELGPMFLGLGPGGLKPALKGFSKLIQPSTISAAEKAGMAQVGLGTGLAGGMEAGREYVQGEEIDPVKIAINSVVGGALQNQPTRLGRRILGLNFPGAGGHLVEEGVPKTSRTYEEITPIEVKEEVEIQPKPEISSLPEEDIQAAKEVKQAPVTAEKKLIEELQNKEVKPSFETDQSEVVKKGEGPDRPQTEEEDYISDPGEKFYSEEEKQLLQAKLSPEDYAKAQELANQRGVKLEQQPTIISEVTNQPARGMAIPTKREAFVSDIATSDTGYHEISHPYLKDLKNSSKPTDVEFYNRGVKAAGSEENLAQALGERKVAIENRPLRTWLDDAYQNIKRVSKLGSPDDVKLAARRFSDDRPYAESPELHKDLNEFTQRFYSEDNSSANGSNRTAGPAAKKPSAGFGPFTALVDRIAAKGSSGKIAANAITGAERETSRLNGKLTENMKFEANKIKDKEAAARYIWESRYTKPKVILNNADRAIVDGELNKLYREVHKEQNENGPLIDGKRQAISNPNLKGPNGIKQEVLRTLIDKPENDVHRRTLVQDFIDHQIKFDEDIRNLPSPEAKQTAAKEKFNTILSGYSAATKGSTASFNALRKAEGIGIPWTWMEKDPVKLFSRYGNRVARDLAYYRNIESKPEVAALFGLEKVKGVEPLVGDEMKIAQRRLTGEHTYNETLFNSIEHFVRGLILGPVTGIKNTVSTFAQILPYVPSKELSKVVEAFAYIKKGYIDSMEMGVNRRNITALEVGDEGVNPVGVTRLGETLKYLGDIARKYTGANAIEQWTRAHNMALGELLTQSYWGRASKGDIDAVRFLKKFTPEESQNFKIPLTEEVLKETAARFVERVQGTYGSRGLPGFLLEPSSPAYWFMSLSKWSVEKANVIKQDVINPALKGEDYGPLLRYALGGLVTGEVIRRLGEELMGGKKAQSPDFKELQAKGKADDWAYKFFELSSLAGLGGIYSDLLKATGDLTKGYNTRGYNIPSVEIAKDLAGETAAAAQAIQEGQDPREVIFNLVHNIITDNVQALKVASNFSNPEEVDRLNKFRDKRVYDKLEGKNIPPVSNRMDRYGGMAEREFKRSKTAEEAGSIYNEKIRPKLQELPRKKKLDKLSQLKRNSYQVVPSDRKEAEDYLSYIKETQGSEAAKALREDKRRQDLVNRQKQRYLR